MAPAKRLSIGYNLGTGTQLSGTPEIAPRTTTTPPRDRADARDDDAGGTDTCLLYTSDAADEP